MEIIKAILFGIVEGITEWLPISSTGHMILLNEFINLNVSKDFYSLFEVVIQLGAIMAVVVMYFKTIWPFGFGKTKKETKETFNLWGKILVACVPAAIIGILLDDWLDAHLYNSIVVSLMLIIYGIIFIVVESKNMGKGKTENLNERDLFKSDNISPFFDFDEEEFSNMSRVQKPKTTNVMEYERKKRVEKRYDMGNFSKIERTEVVEKKKFKPSPIISPVYGILNEDYKPEDIKSKTDNVVNTGLDFNSVRKKAFGEETLGEPEATYYEESVTVKVKENEEEKQQKVKTIDELLEDTSDVTIDVDEKNSVEDKNNKEATNEVADYERIDKDLEEVTAKCDVNKTEMKKVEDDDTLENDLFDLIDSMYDNREEGDI